MQKREICAKTVHLFGEEISVSAEICALHGISGHADRDGLLKWVQAIKRKLRVVFVNHGDEENCEAFATGWFPKATARLLRSAGRNSICCRGCS